jgi:hypothetical protein
MATKTIGSSGKDYTSIASWLSSWVPSTLTEPEIAVCYDPSDSAQIDISGKTTSAANYIKIVADASVRHAGAYDAGKMKISWSGTGNCIRITGVNYVRLEGLQFYKSSGTSSSVYCESLSASSDIRVEQCISRGVFANSTEGISSGSGCITVANCVMFDHGGAAGAYAANGTTSMLVLNCTFYNCNRAVMYDGATASVVTAINNIAAASAWTATFRNDGTTWGTGTDYNASSGGSSTSDVTGKTHDQYARTFTFINTGSFDFHLNTSDTGAKALGTNLSGYAYPISIDIDYQTPDSTWNIGADQFAAAGSNVTPTTGHETATGYVPLINPQLIHMGSDDTDGGWTTESGGSVLYASIDEATPNDSDDIQSGVSPSHDVCKIKFSSAIDPVRSDEHTIRYRISSTSGTGNLAVKLYCGATLIKTWTHTSVPSTLTTYTQVLSGGEADTITDYTNLYLWFDAY